MSEEEQEEYSYLESKSFPEKKPEIPEGMPEFLTNLINPAASALIDIINKDLATSNLTYKQKDDILRRLYFTVKLLNFNEFLVDENGDIILDKKNGKPKTMPMTPRSLLIMMGLLYGDLNLSRSVGAKQLELLFTQRYIAKQQFEERKGKKKLKRTTEW